MYPVKKIYKLFTTYCLLIAVFLSISSMAFAANDPKAEYDYGDFHFEFYDNGSKGSRDMIVSVKETDEDIGTIKSFSDGSDVLFNSERTSFVVCNKLDGALYHCDGNTITHIDDDVIYGMGYAFAISLNGNAVVYMKPIYHENNDRYGYIDGFSVNLYKDGKILCLSENAGHWDADCLSSGLCISPDGSSVTWSEYWLTEDMDPNKYISYLYTNGNTYEICNTLSGDDMLETVAVSNDGENLWLLDSSGNLFVQDKDDVNTRQPIANEIYGFLEPALYFSPDVSECWLPTILVSNASPIIPAGVNVGTGKIYTESSSYANAFIFPKVPSDFSVIDPDYKWDGLGLGTYNKYAFTFYTLDNVLYWSAIHSYDSISDNCVYAATLDNKSVFYLTDTNELRCCTVTDYNSDEVEYDDCLVLENVNSFVIDSDGSLLAEVNTNGTLTNIVVDVD